MKGFPNWLFRKLRAENPNPNKGFRYMRAYTEWGFTSQTAATEIFVNLELLRRLFTDSLSSTGKQ
jgi:hypothetical protein